MVPLGTPPGPGLLAGFFFWVEKDGGFRPIAADPPWNGEGDHRRWWRGTGGAALRIKDRKHLACPSTMLRIVPHPQKGRNGSSPPQRRRLRYPTARSRPSP